ncbi:MAG: sulfite exporter TauE/SafE family protein [Anaerolineaceae bacterium]
MDVNFFLVILVGFIAQLIDGSLGMAYGVSANSFLLGVGIPPAVASASVHTAEIVTTAVSGASHWKLGNVDKKMVRALLIPGVIGGALGAYILTSLDGNKIKPYIAVYLIIMGIRILVAAFKPATNPEEKQVSRWLIPLGFFGGAFDALGGGGWGPIVTTTLISSGHAPRKVIGSVNLSEFFVTFAEVVLFIATIGLSHWHYILGLLIGGVLAAPLGAFLTKKIPAKVLMIIVGVLIIFLQCRTLYQIYF